ncbi:MAG: molybdenum cofactor guanylyltransferase [Planctomycetota bacterium]
MATTPDGASPGRAERTAVILCGGGSTRMGSDKALLQMGEQTLLERTLAAVEPHVTQCLLACGTEPRYEHLGLPLILDTERDGGPLIGLLCGLESARTEWVLLVACDMPALGDGLLARLVAQATDASAATGASAAADADVDVWLFEDDGGLHPLCALYRRCSVLPAVRAALAAGERSMVSFWGHPGEDGRTLVVRRLQGTVDGTAAGLDPLANLNTHEDLERARQTLRLPVEP